MATSPQQIRQGGKERASVYPRLFTKSFSRRTGLIEGAKFIGKVTGTATAIDLLDACGAGNNPNILPPQYPFNPGLDYIPVSEDAQNPGNFTDGLWTKPSKGKVESYSTPNCFQCGTKFTLPGGVSYMETDLIPGKFPSFDPANAEVSISIQHQTDNPQVYAGLLLQSPSYYGGFTMLINPYGKWLITSIDHDTGILVVRAHGTVPNVAPGKQVSLDTYSDEKDSSKGWGDGIYLFVNGNYQSAIEKGANDYPGAGTGLVLTNMSQTPTEVETVFSNFLVAKYEPQTRIQENKRRPS